MLLLALVARIGAALAEAFRFGPREQAPAGDAADAADAALPAAAEAVPGALVLRRDQRFGFVQQFGMDPRELAELYMYTVAGRRLHELPQPVQELLRRLHERGCAVGSAITGFLFHDRPLAEGEAIYVAVGRSGTGRASRALAFLDRRYGELQSK